MPKKIHVILWLVLACVVVILYEGFEIDFELQSIPQGYQELSTHFECQLPEWCDTYFNDSIIIQERLYQLQHPIDCYQARFLVFPEEFVSGMGSSIHIKANTIGIAVGTNRTFILPDGSVWRYATGCDPETFECYFEPLTSCSTSLHAPDWATAPILTKMNEHADIRVVRLANDWIDHQPEGFSWVYWVPPEYPKDRFWWHAQLTKYVTRPNTRTLQIVAKEQQKVFPNGIPHPLISMYVRHGDKWKEAKLLNFSLYMDVVNNITKKVDIRDIYLGTDDPLVIQEALEIQKQGRYRFHYIDTSLRSSNQGLGPLDIIRTQGKNLVRVSLADLFIQIQGDVFVGTRSSNWCRMIDEIRKVNGKARIPFFSPEPPHLLFEE